MEPHTIEKLLSVTDSGFGSRLDLRVFASENNLTETDIRIYHDNLTNLGLVEAVGHGLWVGITERGLEYISRYRELERIKELAPAPRGKAFEVLVSKSIEWCGWKTINSAKTLHEEIDVIFSMGTDFYLVECKWLADPVQAAVVREFYGKLSNRQQVDGVIISMSGFTAGAVEQVQDYKNAKSICLFGPNDINSLILLESNFTETLISKKTSMVANAKLEWA